MKSVSIAITAFLALSACSKNIDNTESVKQGVLRDIPKDVNVGAMDVNVVSVTFRGQEADAVVSFAPKGGAPMMSMNYTMERKGNEWHIKKRANGDLQKHAGQAAGGAGSAGPIGGDSTQLPPGHPSTGGAPSSAPPISGDSTQLPPGHPPLNGANK